MSRGVTYLIELATNNAGTADQILGWSKQTRCHTKRDALSQAAMYQSRGFWVRITVEGGRIPCSDVLAPTHIKEAK